MTLDIFIAKDSVRIYAVQNPGEVVETGIKCPEFITLKPMRFGPMRSPLVPTNDFFECLEQFAIGYVKTVGFVLHNSNPATLLGIARTQPDVIGSGKSDLHRKMGPNAMWIPLFFLKILTQFTKAGLRIFVRNRPLRGMLWIPTIDVENPVTDIYAQAISAYKPTSEIGDVGIEK